MLARSIQFPRTFAAPETGGGSGSGYKGKPHTGADERIDPDSSIVELNKRTGTAGVGVRGQDPGDSALVGSGDAGVGTAGAAGPGTPGKARSGGDAERAGGGPTSAGTAPPKGHGVES